MTGNSVNATIDTSDTGYFIDQNLGADDGIPTHNPIYNFMINIAYHMEAYDTPVSPYYVNVAGYNYLTLVGGNLFLEGIPNLVNMCPILFQTGSEKMSATAPEHSGAYAQTLNPAQKWGYTVANGLTMLGSYMGINQALAGSVVLFAIVIGFAVYIYSRTESGIIVLLMVSATPFIGAYLGLMPIALSFIVVIIVITLLGYFFFSRGSL
jgi:hypothetical protein